MQVRRSILELQPEWRWVTRSYQVLAVTLIGFSLTVFLFFFLAFRVYCVSAFSSPV